DGRLLAAGGQDGTIRLWEPTTDKPVRTFENGRAQWVHDPRGISHWIDHLAFAPDGRTLISHGEDGSVRFWDVARGRETWRLKPPEGRGSASFTYSSDGRTLALWEKDATIRILDAATGEEKRRLTGVVGERPLLRFSPDERSLVSMNGIGGAAVVR